MRPIVAGLLLTALALGQTQPVKNPHTTAADAAAGARIFRSHCADCHGLTGKGGKGPDLTTGVFFHGGSDAELHRTITDGIEGTAMPGQFFSADQVWQIVTHVRALSRGGTAKAPPGDPVRGTALFNAKGCNGCHLIRGNGGVQGPDLSFIGSQRPATQLRQSILDPSETVDRTYWTAEVTLENGEAYKGFVMNEDTYYVQILHPSRGLLSLPKRNFRKFEVSKASLMPSYKDKLNDAELNDIVAYLWTLQRPRRAE
ncbi:MAG TPA: c-type cytochrome [Bryobacteraceae bacterium]|nr:c-type cytochrome [Bryobacteraceae bacterium]